MMLTDLNAALGFAQIMSEYDAYVEKTKAQNKKPLSILAYLVEMFQ